MATCLEFKVHKRFPFNSIQISDTLSLLNVVLSVYPCDVINSSKNTAFGRYLLVPTCSVLVELQVFIICLADMSMTVPCPKDICCTPVCTLMSLYTAKAASTDQYMLPFPSIPIL